jgi:hypothetical protein
MGNVGAVLPVWKMKQLPHHFKYLGRTNRTMSYAIVKFKLVLGQLPLVDLPLFYCLIFKCSCTLTMTLISKLFTPPAQVTLPNKIDILKKVLAQAD